jgi:hypothetical protein
MNGHNQPDPHDLPGFDRATNIDDPTPRHEYRDEPPRWQQTPVRTVYTIHEARHTYTTTDPDVAEVYSRAGLRVTAETHRVIA